MNHQDQAVITKNTSVTKTKTVTAGHSGEVSGSCAGVADGMLVS
ncbi:MAG: hypothetical protein ABJA98_12895 [Acidobacteriota bacterium]